MGDTISVLTEELQKRTEVLRIIQETLPVAVWEADREGNISIHEGKGLASAGLEQGQYLGKNLSDIFHGGEAMDMIKQVLAGQSVHLFAEFEGVPWESWYVPGRDASGQVTSIVGISLDISAARQAEKELRAHVEMIEQQRRAIRSLSTPIIEIWDRVLTLPMVGLVDSGRVAEVMEALLARVVETQARFAILDLTGVDAVDTGTASHLLNLIRAIGLLGAEGIVTGIKPSVARTVVELGLDMGSITTRARLRDGLQWCIARMNADPG